MPQNSIHDTIRQSFPKSHKADWLRAAAAEIQGKNPEEALTWKTKDAINFFSYYNRQDVRNIDYLRSFGLRPSHNPHGGPRTWVNLPNITVSTEKKANAIARNHLSMGADGVLFDVRKSKEVDINALLDNIEWPYCNVSFWVTPSTEIVRPLASHIEKKKFDPGLLTGTLFWETLPNDVPTVIRLFETLPDFHALGIWSKTTFPAQEISEVLVTCVKLMDDLTDKGIGKEIAWQNIALSLPTGIDFFPDICKLKALRVLWYQVAMAYGINGYAPGDVHLHVHTSTWIAENFQPHSNMLNATSSALAAVIGGCDSLTTAPEDEDHSTMNRVARNVSNILREEGQLDKVSDPLAGAYAVDTMVDIIAKQAWTEFQRNVMAI